MFGMIWFHTVKSQAENDFSDIFYKKIFIVFLYHFLPVLYTVVNYPNTWFTRSFLARSVHKSNKIYNKIQNIWFPLPTYSVLQLLNSVSEKMWCCLTFVCVYSYMTTWIKPPLSENGKCKILHRSPSDPIYPFDILFIFNKHKYMQRE